MGTFAYTMTYSCPVYVAPIVPQISDFSSRPWRNLSPTWVIHMATRRPAHNTPIHMDLGPTMQELHMNRGVVGWSAGRHVTHVGGKSRHGLLKKSLKKVTSIGKCDALGKKTILLED